MSEKTKLTAEDLALNVHVQTKIYEIENRFSEEDVSFYPNAQYSSFIFKNCSFKKFKVLGGELSILKFINCNFELLSFEDQKIKNELIIENCKAEEIVFNSGTYNVTFLSDNIIGYFNLNGGQFLTSFTISNQEMLTSVNPEIRNLSIHINHKIKTDRGASGLFGFSNIQIGKLSIVGNPINCEFYFKDIKANHLSIFDFTNTGVIEFLNLQFIDKNESSILIENSTPKNLRLINADFSKINISIIHSDLTEIITSNVIWSKQINRNLPPLEQREVYRQLKANANRQHDTIGYLGFQEKELEAYHQYLKTTKSNFQDRFILWTNKISNDHGRSWSRAFLLIILFTATSYVFLSLTTYCPTNEIRNNWAKAFYMFNPTHKLNEVFESYKHENTAIVIDSISKILIGYLLFQMFRAFRKFIR